jgi:dihydrodipicolinate reductase
VKVILLGATGMVGQGVLRECLLDPEVDTVLAIGRNATASSTRDCTKSYTTTFLISLQLKVSSQATTHAFSASASPQ